MRHLPLFRPQIKIIRPPWNYPDFQHVYLFRPYPFDFPNKNRVSFE